MLVEIEDFAVKCDFCQKSEIVRTELDIDDGLYVI